MGRLAGRTYRQRMIRPSLIRLARNADCHLLPAIERSAGELFRTIGMGDVTDDGETNAEIWEPICENGTLWVATDETDTPVGFLAAGEQANLLFVYELAISTPFQGRGLGKQLMGAAGDYAHRHKQAGLALTTFCDVPWNAPYYQRMGFEIVPDQDLPQPIQTIIAAEHERFPAADRRRCAMIKPLDV